MKSEIFEALTAALEAEQSAALVTVLEGECCGEQLLLLVDGTVRGSPGPASLQSDAIELAHRCLESGASMRARPGGFDVFVEFSAPRPSLIVVGAVHIAVALVHLARSLGFRTCVIDPRTVFATPERFVEADTLLAEWPGPAMKRHGLHESTAVAVLSHDPKIDIPALSAALNSPARYVGALGSRKTHAKRIAALREAGHTDEQIARIRSPIGLDLGGRSPSEIALAILAEIVAAGHGKIRPGER